MGQVKAQLLENGKYFIPKKYTSDGESPEDYTPEHYTGWQVGKFITKQNLSFYEGCVVKYVCRHRKKDGLKDLHKAKDYIEQLIKEYTNASSTE